MLSDDQGSLAMHCARTEIITPNLEPLAELVNTLSTTGRILSQHTMFMTR